MVRIKMSRSHPLVKKGLFPPSTHDNRGRKYNLVEVDPSLTSRIREGLVDKIRGVRRKTKIAKVLLIYEYRDKKRK